MNKTNKFIYNFIKEVTTEKGGNHSISVYKKNVDREYVSEWTNNQEVKLLTLDGSFVGKNGTEYDYLSTDTTAQDDWHIGKKYNMQCWFRYPIVISENTDGKVCIRHTTEEDVQNAYLIVSKRMLRMKSKNLKRTKTEELESISNDMVSSFIENFNRIENGDVYMFRVGRYVDNNSDVFEIDDVCGKLTEKNTMEEVAKNIPFMNTEFDTLLKEVFYSIE